MSEFGELNNDQLIHGSHTPISINTANLYLTNSSTYTTQPHGLNASHPLAPGTSTMADRYSKPHNKMSAPNSLRKSTKF